MNPSNNWSSPAGIHSEVLAGNFTAEEIGILFKNWIKDSGLGERKCMMNYDSYRGLLDFYAPA